jgi:glycosyltransferase involved in cell wall biosynthesis
MAKNQCMPLVSIVIPVYNGSNYLREAIESAISQTYRNCEILVVNDGSDDRDETEKIALSYGSKIRYFKKENGGVASALNVGIHEMRGEYFSWLSHDDVYYPHKIEKEIEMVTAGSDPTKIVHCGYEFYDMDTNERTGTDFLRYYPKQVFTNSVFPVFQVQLHACSALVHKSNFERVGMFDESIRTVQDIEMWFRLLRHERSLFVDEPLMMVREHHAAGSRTERCYKKETCQIYEKLIDKMTEDEIADIYGSAWNFLVRMAGFIRSYGGNAEALEMRLSKYPPSQEDESNTKELVRRMEVSGSSRIYIFGAGQLGMRTLYELQRRNIGITGFIDNNPNLNGKIIDGLPCSSLEDIPQKSNIIVAVRNGNGILCQLRDKHYDYVITRQELDGRLAKQG